MRPFVRYRVVRGVVTAVVLVTAAATGSVAVADDERSSVIQVPLTGYQEDPLALSTTGAGDVSIRIDDGAQTITYRLEYDGLEGNVLQSHIHLGGRAQSGGVSVFLCSNLGNGPAGTPACPAQPGVVEGTLHPADVIGPAGQGIAAGEFNELVAAIRSGTAYANVHSSKYPGGEIRGQLDHEH
ncbi:MAG TPA: CHRD domain-containing protein [Kribbellaceae bacterium]|nr:CHRD domain-containing protein [Kribbellaceae bacterium]